MKKRVFLMVAVAWMAMTVEPQMMAAKKEKKVEAKAEPAKCEKETAPTVVMYDEHLTGGNKPSDLILPEGKAAYEEQGLKVTKGGLVKLNRYYSLAERRVRYVVNFKEDTKALFQSDTKDFISYVDVKKKMIGIKLAYKNEAYADFLNVEHEYMVEMILNYNTSTLKLTDLYTGEEVSVSATNDGPGGAGIGVVNWGLGCGLHRDYYVFGAEEGELLVKQVTVAAEQCGYTLLIYGDSITEPESYFPASMLDKAWVQLIMANVKGKAAASGRGGTIIDQLLERIKNELPYVKSKYVMITIGTNGGNTEEKLCQLVEYILSQHSIPILNNIPSNEHNSQVEVNKMIAKVREKYGIKGCLFDIPTSLGKDGQVVDKSTMWTEDLGNNVFFYHHPNVRGARLMYLQSLRDVPEIYE